MINCLNAKIGEKIEFRCPNCKEIHQMTYEEGSVWHIFCKCGEIWDVVLRDDSKWQGK